MKKTILLLINANSNDLPLIDYAVALAKSHHSFLELFDARWITHALPLELVPTNIVEVEEMKHSTNTFEYSEGQMELLCQLIKEKWTLTDYKLARNLMYGHLPNKRDFWMDEIKNIQPKAIVMRVKNELNIWNEMFGTEETKIAEEANCPVLLLPKKISVFNPLKTIGYFLDREKSIDEAIIEIQFLSNISKIHNGELSIYYFSDAAEKEAKLELAVVRSKLSNAIDFEQMRIRDFSNFYTPKVLNDLVKIRVNNLIAFPQREKSFLQRLTDNDNTKRLILGANIPVLVF